MSTAKPGAITQPGSRLGVRREVSILLPVALLLLALLALFTLMTYRSAIDLLAEERREEARRLAVAIADAVATGGASDSALRRQAPLALGVAVWSASEGGVTTIGSFPALSLLTPLDGRLPTVAVGLGPTDTPALEGRVVGFAPRPGGGAVRVDLDARLLAQQQRGMPLLTAIVSSVSVATLVLVLVFLRHLLAPIDALMARARSLGEPAVPGQDDLTFLLATFDRAMAAIAGATTPTRPEPRSGDDELTNLGRTLAPRLDSGLLLLDRDLTVLALSPVGSELLGATPSRPRASLGEALERHPELATRLADALADTADTASFDWPLATDDGVRTLGFTVHHLRTEGELRGHLVLFADLTHKRHQAAAEALAASLAQLGELSAGVAHELRNSLSTLTGYLGLLAPEVTTDTGREFLAEVEEETRQLVRVVGDFLAFASPGTIRLGPVDLHALVESSLADPVAGAVAIVRSLAARPGEAVVLGDRQLLARAWHNLLSNAIHAATDEGRRGVLVVRLGRVSLGWELAVDDDGPGVSPALRDRLFMPFASGRREGVGLGLALAHRIVALHGGRLTLVDRPEGGTSAVMHLPVSNVP